VRTSSLLKAIGGSLACSLVAGSAAHAAVPHVVQPGESLWSIAAANNLTTRTVAVYNGLSESAGLLQGTTVYVPTVAEGAAALASGAPAVSAPATAGTAPATTTTPPATTTSAAVPPGMGYVSSPYGSLPLAPGAAASWEAMRSESLATYGIDLYPGGTLSAYRTYDQQAQLYQAYLDGYGAPANPPGTSSHELGISVDVPTENMRWVIDQIGWKHGWTKVHGPGEWWHVDYAGG
jgi:LysM repeat protein